MSGPENLRGMDYQVAYSMYATLQSISGAWGDISSFQFESLYEDEEDFNLTRNDGLSEYFQIKKKGEAYLWKPSELKAIFEKFYDKDSEDVATFIFISNAAGNKEIVKLKKELEGKLTLSEELIAQFRPNSISNDKFLDLLKKVRLHTRAFSTNDDARPALVLEKEIKAILQKHPFQIDKSIDSIYDCLWKLIFDHAKKADKINVAQLALEFKHIGLFIVSKPWLLLPELNEFVGRDSKISELLSNLNKSKLFVIHGISSIGKTSFTATFAMRLISEAKLVFWFSINKLTEISELQKLLSSFFSYHGKENYAQSINNSERSQLGNKIADALLSTESYIFLDGINNCSENIRSFLEDLCKATISSTGLGKLLLTSTETPSLYTAKDILNQSVYELNLLGLDDSECKNILVNNGILLNSQQIKLLAKSVGGHPLSILFYCQISKEKTNHDEQFANLKEKSVSAAQEYLIEQAITALPEEEKLAILQLCIIPYSFPIDFIDGYLANVISLKSLLKSLTRKNLLIFDGLDYVIHDSIQSSCMALLTSKETAQKHSILAEFLQKKLQANLTDEEPNILYSDGFKWAYHKEQSSKEVKVEQLIELLLKLSNDDLDALWAIERYGYPFDYISEDLSFSSSCVKRLTSNQLIKPSNVRVNQYEVRLYETIELNSDEFAHVFLVYLCISRGISNYMGYIDTQEYNYASDKQCYVVCQWEHCIELQPLPPITRKEHEEHLKFLKEQFAIGAYDSKPPQTRAMLLSQLEDGVPRDAPETPDTNLEAMRCPVFGHCCPGGTDQADACRQDI